MAKNKFFFMLCLFIVAIVVVMFFAFRVGVGYNANDIEVTWSAFNTSLAVLEIYIVIFSIGLIIVGIWGFREIKEKCIDAVLKETEQARKDVIEQFKKMHDTIYSDDWEGAKW